MRNRGPFIIAVLGCPAIVPAACGGTAKPAWNVNPNPPAFQDAARACGGMI